MSHVNPAQRRYLHAFMPLMATHLLILFGVNRLVIGGEVDRLTLTLLGALPALPLIGVMVILGRYLMEERDEFIRNRLIFSMLGGTAILLAGITIWGFLENAGVVGHPPTFLAFPFWCGAMGLSQLFLSLKDRIADTRA